MTPQKKLWLEVINKHTSEVIYPFKIPTSGDSINIQYRELSDKIVRNHENKRFRVFGKKRGTKLCQEYMRSIWFFEYGQLDEICEDIGLGHQYANKIFNFVQDVLTKKKHLREKEEKLWNNTIRRVA